MNFINKKSVSIISLVILAGWYLLSGDSNSKTEVENQLKQDVELKNNSNLNQEQYKKEFLSVVEGKNNNFYKFKANGYENDNFIINGVLYKIEKDRYSKEKSVKLSFLNPLDCADGNIKLFFNDSNFGGIYLTCVDDGGEKWSNIDFNKEEYALIEKFYDEKISIYRNKNNSLKTVTGKDIFADKNNENILKGNFVIEDSLREKLTFGNQLYTMIKNYLMQGKNVKTIGDINSSETFEFILNNNVKLKIKNTVTDSEFYNGSEFYKGYMKNQHMYVELPLEESNKTLEQEIVFYKNEIKNLITSFLDKKKKENFDKAVKALNALNSNNLDNLNDKGNANKDK